MKIYSKVKPLITLNFALSLAYPMGATSSSMNPRQNMNNFLRKSNTPSTFESDTYDTHLVLVKACEILGAMHSQERKVISYPDLWHEDHEMSAKTHFSLESHADRHARKHTDLETFFSANTDQEASETNTRIQDCAMLNGICKSGYDTPVPNGKLSGKKPAVMHGTLAFETARLTKYHDSLAFLLYVSTERTYSFRVLYDKIAMPRDKGHVCASKYRKKRVFKVKCKQIFEMEVEAHRLAWL